MLDNVNHISGVWGTRRGSVTQSLFFFFFFFPLLPVHMTRCQMRVSAFRLYIYISLPHPHTHTHTHATRHICVCTPTYIHTYETQDVISSYSQYPCFNTSLFSQSRKSYFKMYNFYSMKTSCKRPK